jgi:hypothetical protein
MLTRPEQIVVFAYQVGFGDCFLLRFRYPRRDRHVLIDFGTTKLPDSAGTDPMLAIARDIATKCDGALEAVVATHRHADHISGFARNSSGTGPGDVIRALKPQLVIQPWTEHPDLQTDATGPASGGDIGRARRFADALASMQGIAAQVHELAQGPHARRLSAAVKEQLAFIGQDNLTNRSAVENLMTMGARSAYVSFGASAGLSRLLPGVRVHVLGPPTLRQSAAARKQRARDPDEFWHLQLQRLGDEGGLAMQRQALFPNRAYVSGGKLPFSSRWLAQRLRTARGEQLLELVRILDDALNNTSVILLFEAGGRKLLFPGDAQVENWSYALSQPRVRRLLAGVDLYKVGHHGSLNATPKTVWGLFNKRSTAQSSGRLTTVLSTLPGKHGREASNTEVPRGTLLRALQAESNLHSTHLLPGGALLEEVSIALT